MLCSLHKTPITRSHQHTKGGEIAKGAEVTAGEAGLAAAAAAGDYVIGLALDAAQKDEYCRIQIMKYQKN